MGRSSSVRAVQSRVAELTAAAPSAYPDGSRFPAPQALEALGQVMIDLRSVRHVDMDGIVLRVGWIMALFKEVAETQPTTDTIQTFYETRMWLNKQGLGQAETIVAQAGLDLVKYWEQNGAWNRMIDEAADRHADT